MDFFLKKVLIFNIRRYLCSMIMNLDTTLFERVKAPFLLDMEAKPDVYGNYPVIRKERCIFFDCETVPQTASFEELPAAKQDCFRKKILQWNSFRDNQYAQSLNRLVAQIKNKEISSQQLLEEFEKVQEQDVPNSYKETAALFPEYGKIVVISARYWSFKTNDWVTSSFVETFDENGVGMGDHTLLAQFQIFLLKQADNIFKITASQPVLFAHNGAMFDVPYITNRFIQGKMTPPGCFYRDGQKPWNSTLRDTKNTWAAGSKNGDNTLHTILTVLDLQTSKDDICGSEVAGVYYNGNQSENIHRIVTYCEKDVQALHDLYEHYQNLTTVKI